MTVGKGESVLINGERVELSRLSGRPARIFQARGDDVIFITGDRDVKFRKVAEVIDLASGVGLRRVALIADRVDMPAFRTLPD